MSTPPVADNQPGPQANGRQPLLLAGGIVLLGLALVLVLFGGQWLGAGDETPASAGTQTDILPQVPAFEAVESASVPLPTGGGPLSVGDLAYDFTLLDLDGNRYRLSELGGHPVILNFWATWCAPCRVEMPELEAAFAEHKEQGLLILALDQQEPPEFVRDFFYGQMGLTFTPLLDSDGAVADLYGTNNILPTSFFINPQGEITAIHRGPMVQSQIEGYLADTIPGG